jgi:hypothetical protein
LKAAHGINKYIWNRDFDIHPYNAGETAYLEEVFDRWISANPERATYSAYRRFLDAETDRQRRLAVESLNNTYHLGIPASYGISMAGPGEYQVILRAEGMQEQKKLLIREDPLLGQ